MRLRRCADHSHLVLLPSSVPAVFSVPPADLVPVFLADLVILTGTVPTALFGAAVFPPAPAPAFRPALPVLADRTILAAAPALVFLADRLRRLKLFCSEFFHSEFFHLKKILRLKKVLHLKKVLRRSFSLYFCFDHYHCNPAFRFLSYLFNRHFY